jgi:hypothetical protein
VRRGERHVDVARFADRLAAVHRFDHRELACPLLQRACDAVQVLAALGGLELRPAAQPGTACGGNRAVDVGGIRLRYLRERLRVRRVDRVEVATLARRHELAVDEEPVLRIDAGVVGALRCRRILPARVESEPRVGSCHAQSREK